MPVPTTTTTGGFLTPSLSSPVKLPTTVYELLLLDTSQLTSITDLQAPPPPHSTTLCSLYPRCLLLDDEDTLDARTFEFSAEAQIIIEDYSLPLLLAMPTSQYRRHHRCYKPPKPRQKLKQLGERQLQPQSLQSVENLVTVQPQLYGTRSSEVPLSY